MIYSARHVQALYIEEPTSFSVTPASTRAKGSEVHFPSVIVLLINQSITFPACS